MQAVILAAGMGRRLGALTREQTKCMVKVHGQTLLERSLDALIAAKLERIVLVVGYGAAGVRELVGDSYGGVPVSYIENVDFATTNNIYSLYLARDELAADDTLLLESDLIYDPTVVSDLVDAAEPNLAVVAPFQTWMDGTVVTLSPEGDIQEFIPKKHINHAAGHEYFKTVNIYKFSREYLVDSYLPFLEAYVRAAGNNEYYEQVLRVIASLDRNDLKALRLADQKWYEIDDVQDLQIAETLFAPEENQYAGYLNRHGGFWRFPELRDFCYLVNPYFPTRGMLDEMHRSMDVLLREYPSSAYVVDALGGKMFGLAPGNVIVGNGAAELITALGQVLPAASVGISIPTFEEYLKRFPHAVVDSRSASGPDFGQSLEELKALAANVDALVLVNPDNPSGRCLSEHDVHALAAHMEQAGKRLILDESFVDFADPEHCRSLLTPETLERYPSLLIIKSISKSYGVPGARLGVLASADTSLLAAARQATPVWNINSFGEFFLQIIGKYQGDYEIACQQIRAERQRFTASLQGIDGLRVIPSQANYLLCEVTAPVSTARLANRLLQEYRILIKDAAGKPGLGAGAYVRVAVRDDADNSYFVEAIRVIMIDVKP